MLARFRLALLLLGLLLFACATPPHIPVAEPDQPKLVVLVVFDQLRGDYLTRWDALFGEDGFHRLEKNGAWFQNCHYPYAHTMTAPGHASVATGCCPVTHGVFANEWFDRAAGEKINCVENDRYQRVPPWPVATKKDDDRASETDGAKTKTRYGVAPDRLLAPTLADALKEATNGKGRVVSLSFKDRSAVLPGGRKPDACYWFDPDGGLFVTSTYYRDSLRDWVDEFNKSRLADRWFNKDWTRLRKDLDYERYSGPDDVVGEGKGVFQGRTFPHATNGGPFRVPAKPYYQALYNSPFGNDLLLELAKSAIDAEKLGSGDDPDLLCVSFSSNDAIGHVWGPDSQEVLDVTLRSDLILSDLFKCLDAKVGKGKYVVALTADHGVCPLPEVAVKQGKDAGRIDLSLLDKKASAFLDETYGAGEGKERWFESGGVLWGYFNRALLDKRGLKEAEVEEAMAAWLEKQPGIQKVYTRTQLAKGLPKEDALGQSVLKSYRADRSGDLFIIPMPYHVIWEKLIGTGHGTPHEYDTHVPLLVYGPGVKPGVYKDAITPLATPVILAKMLGIKAPAKADAEVAETLFTTPNR